MAGEREDWELTTISARQRQGRPAGLAWQWKVESLVESLSTIGYNPLQGKRLVDGFLYGRLDQMSGRLRVHAFTVVPGRAASPAPGNSPVTDEILEDHKIYNKKFHHLLIISFKIVKYDC